VFCDCAFGVVVVGGGVVVVVVVTAVCMCDCHV